MLPAESPAMMREMASVTPVSAYASIHEEAALASSVTSSTGRRPIRSERLPQSGAPTSWPAE